MSFWTTRKRTLTCSRSFWVLFLICFTSNSLAAPASKVSQPYEKEVLAIPKKPSNPPAIIHKVPEEIPHCERYFVHKGKKIECDSNLGKDAEHLRSIVHDVPQALSELDIYQENQKTVKTAAYLGTFGIVALLAGVLMSRPPFDPTTGMPRLGGFFVLGGVGLTAGSLIYGFSMVRLNEAHIGNAVNYYNAAHPDQPIELQFSTGVNF